MPQKIVHLRIELENIEPRIWRRVDVSLTTNLRALHDLIQAVMPWESYHLYEFAVGDRIYGEPDPEDAFWDRKVYQAKSLRLSMLIDRGITEFLYTYDFGDDWRHRIVIEGVSDAEPDLDYPIFLGGERRAPPEDVGGPPGFMEFVEAISKRSHPQHKDMVRWYGGPFHPTDFGEADIAQRVREIAARRKAAYETFQRSREMRQR
ncbi:plasmid pRiA4b ORF-3 family protein [Roseovarius sp. SCSIO 43702]|uniref:plasmid pRiA4b ORF-3 family protein n=1 Tax=Roseovarius sp. SCSIO 43702 TaxID=2823043 RepID=UPI001C73457C|nr:plasmid pRiA4b ORF-3 family protein [Roseovarius sp. SCSIO 43702]QYX58007.1 plasmid pRiA4b ORF-3 family protein [Roseovarius sp. SCSIO 43702]